MNICHVANGTIRIPPRGWGAVQSIISDYKHTIERLGHKCHIINEKNHEKIVDIVHSLSPDIVHIHNEGWYELANRLNVAVRIISTHQGNFFSRSQATEDIRQSIYEGGFKSGTFFIHCISDKILQYFLNIGIPNSRLFLVKNGARSDLIRFADAPIYPGRSICLGRISARKRQYVIQDLDFIDFAGPRHDLRFNYDSPNYLGEWKKSEVHSRLTDYANLVLLSKSEAAPLVTCEALMAGLGVVVSENAAANLDRDQPFIEIIPEKRISDSQYVRTVILRNQALSLGMRPQIRAYAVRHFDWGPIVSDYIQKLSTFLALSQNTPTCHVATADKTAVQ